MKLKTKEEKLLYKDLLERIKPEKHTVIEHLWYALWYFYEDCSGDIDAIARLVNTYNKAFIDDLYHVIQDIASAHCSSEEWSGYTINIPSWENDETRAAHNLVTLYDDIYFRQHEQLKHLCEFYKADYELCKRFAI